MMRLVRDKCCKKVAFGNHTLNRGVVVVSLLLLITTLAGLTFQLDRFLSRNMDTSTSSLPLLSPKFTKRAPPPALPDPSSDIIAQMRRWRIWDVSKNENQVNPVLINTFPEEFQYVSDVATFKRIFLHSLLPVALIALEEIEQERQTLIDIIDKTGIQPEHLLFGDSETISYATWRRNLSNKEVAFVERITRKYRTLHASELLNRIDVLPMSLILAQGAIESSWGRSRFALEGNNIFGIWTWNNDGLIPTEREPDKKHKVRSYDSILDSVRGYLLTLNRLPTYRKLRAIRQQSDDPLTIAEGLLMYSERRLAYIEDVRDIILQNDLQKYDLFALSESPLETASLQPVAYVLQ